MKTKKSFYFAVEDLLCHFESGIQCILTFIATRTLGIWQGGVEGLHRAVRVLSQLHHRPVEGCAEDAQVVQLRDPGLLPEAQLPLQAAVGAAPTQGRADQKDVRGQPPETQRGRVSGENW